MRLLLLLVVDDAVSCPIHTYSCFQSVEDDCAGSASTIVLRYTCVGCRNKYLEVSEEYYYCSTTPLLCTIHTAFYHGGT